MKRVHCSAILVALIVCFAACHPAGEELHRRGDEISVCGRLFHTGGAPVVLWTDPGGYDAYRTEKRFAPWDRASWTAPENKDDGPASPNRSNIRFAGELGKPGCPLDAGDFERVRGGGWDLPTLRRCVDQLVLHYDVSGTSRRCFHVLHDVRGLSVHFMLDIDGTIYQTLDVKERAWHATTSNDRSVGVEIANIGAYPAPDADPLVEWYGMDADGSVRITVPASMGDGGVRTAGFVGRPRSGSVVSSNIQGQVLFMHDFTSQQYDSLARLTATLCTVLPAIGCDFPRDERSGLITGKLPDDRLRGYRGLLGHYHIQSNKADPGPALDWNWLVGTARTMMGRSSEGNGGSDRAAAGMLE